MLWWPLRFSVRFSSHSFCRGFLFHSGFLGDLFTSTGVQQDFRFRWCWYLRLFSCCLSGTTGSTSGAETAFPFRATEFISVCSWVRVAQSFVFYLVLCGPLFFFLFFIFLVIDLSVLRFTSYDLHLMIYILWLPLWYLQTFLYPLFQVQWDRCDQRNHQI